MTEPAAVYTTAARRGRRPRKTLSARQRALLAYIVNYKRTTQGHSPTIREMMAAVGYSSTSSTGYSLHTLAARGYIELACDGSGKTLDIRIPGARWVGPDETATP